MSDPTHNPSYNAPGTPFASPFQPIPNPPQTRRSGPLAPGIAFVTGGASGLGNAIARSFAREGAKAIVIVDMNGKALQGGKERIEGIGCEVCLSLWYEFEGWGDG